MTHVMQPDLRVVLFFVSLVVKGFKKVFMGRFAMSCIVVYSTTIIANTLSKVPNGIKFGTINLWLT